MEKSPNRRQALNKILATSLLGGLSTQNSSANEIFNTNIKGNIKQSVCKWCYGDFTLDKLINEIKPLGLTAIDLIDVADFSILKKHNMHCSMVDISSKTWGITKGWNKLEHHPELIKWYKYLIDETAKAGYTNIICFSGNREDEISDDEGLENCVEGLSKILPYAKSKKIIIMMELLNSKVDHKQYMCDSIDWGIELCRMLDSENFKLLYDIYHMQIMEGDIIRTIQENKDFIGHYHTGGVPGRAELDESQELYYPAIIKAIVNTGFKGYLGQEFIPKQKDKINSLRLAVELCDV